MGGRNGLQRVFHVLGAGDAMDPVNSAFRARLDYVIQQTRIGDKIIVYGRQQPGTTTSEAASGVAYLEASWRMHNIFYNKDVMADTTPKSTSETMARILSHLSDYEALPAQHIIVTNGIFWRRTRYLLRKQCGRLHPDIPCRTLLSTCHFAKKVGGTYQPNGWQSILNWLWNVGVREILAWGKAIYDPYDTKLNQQRQASRYIG